MFHEAVPLSSFFPIVLADRDRLVSERGLDRIGGVVAAVTAALRTGRAGARAVALMCAFGAAMAVGTGPARAVENLPGAAATAASQNR
ncbi:hypothetical protein EN829_020140 [Mesorhizobium sp. M00.F.Ca.ET.186.01.1.1]|nr:hypothetical protein EN829_020140 [Mesorhizobium sp. M00.F.Ca.ET.186.01.1.1]